MLNQLFRQATYVGSYRSYTQMPIRLKEVAFAGRSNAGKSSAINTLCDHKRLAHTSKTPGRTQCLNLFDLTLDCGLVDLPGYGFAKVNAKEQDAWGVMIEGYFKKRDALAGLVLVMDARHPFKPTDQQMIDFAAFQEIPVHIILTKADKLSQSEASVTLRWVQSQLDSNSTCQLFSALKKRGVDELALKVLEWLELSA